MVSRAQEVGPWCLRARARGCPRPWWVQQLDRHLTSRVVRVQMTHELGGEGAEALDTPAKEARGWGEHRPPGDGYGGGSWMNSLKPRASAETSGLSPCDGRETTRSGTIRPPQVELAGSAGGSRVHVVVIGSSGGMAPSLFSVTKDNGWGGHRPRSQVYSNVAGCWQWKKAHPPSHQGIGLSTF